MAASNEFSFGGAQVWVSSEAFLAELSRTDEQSEHSAAAERRAKKLRDAALNGTICLVSFSAKHEESLVNPSTLYQGLMVAEKEAV